MELEEARYIVAIRGGMVVHRAPNSRAMARLIQPETNATVETVARNIRKRIDTGILYAGYLFVEI